MPFLLGQPIESKRLEQETSSWDAAHFVRMCNDLIWAASGRQYNTMPSLTEQIYVGDGGVDGEWDIKITGDDSQIPLPILKPGLNVFQYKKRDRFAQDKKKIITDLKFKLKSALVDIEKKRGITPVKYILIVNLELRSAQQKSLKQAILHDFDKKEKVDIEIIGAAEIATLLRDNPHIRASYFSPVSFHTWQMGYDHLKSLKFYGKSIDLIGREKEVNIIRSLVDDRNIRVVIINGSPDVGKTRLAFEATKHRMSDVVVALDPRSMNISDFEQFISPHREVVIIIDDPEPRFISDLIKYILTQPKLKVIVTYSTQENITPVSYGFEQRVQCISLKPLDQEDSRRLIKETKKQIDFSLQDWIIKESGGIPGIILAASYIGGSIRSGSQDFTRDVGKQLEQAIINDLGQKAIDCLSLFSVLTFVGIESDYEYEFDAICDIFGNNEIINDLNKWINKLIGYGLVQRGGSFISVRIPILANYLVNNLLSGKIERMFALYAKLKEPAAVRLLKRLSQINMPTIEHFWNELFSQDGPLGTLESALNNAQILSYVTEAVPQKMITWLESKLLNVSYEYRISIKDEPRRELMWALEQLLFRYETSMSALRLIWQLAEAETENYGNNAIGVLSESFQPRQPQFPLTLKEREEAFKEFTSNNCKEGQIVVAIKAVENALSRYNSWSLRTTSSSEPLATRPAYTYDELWEYYSFLVDHLFKLAEHRSARIAKTVLNILPNITAEMGIQVPNSPAIKKFNKLFTWAKVNKPGLSVSDVANGINLMTHALTKTIEEKDLNGEITTKIKTLLKELNNVISKINKNYSLKLRYMIGPIRYNENALKKVESGNSYRYELDLKDLAIQAINNPGLLDQQLMDALIEPNTPNAPTYLYYLGEHDEEGRFRSSIMKYAKKKEGSHAFAAYMSGWANRDAVSAEIFIDKVALDKSITGKSVVEATIRMKANSVAVDRLISQIQNNRVNPVYVANATTLGRWLENLDNKQFEKLIKSISGKNLENGEYIVEVIYMWIHLKKPVSKEIVEIAWRCVEIESTIINSNNDWYFNQVAGLLAEQDKERAFDLLSKLLRRKYTSGGWNPIGLFDQNEFLNILSEYDSKKVLNILIDSIKVNKDFRYKFLDDALNIVDQIEMKDDLISISKSGIEYARAVAELITLEKPGFAEIYIKLVELYPEDDLLDRILIQSMVGLKGVISGPLSNYYQTRRQEIENILKNPDIAIAVKIRLTRLVEELGLEIERQIVWEYDEGVNSLRHYIEDKESALREWAISRVLKYADWKDIRKTLTVADIKKALPNVDISEKKRKTITNALKVWMNEI